MEQTIEISEFPLISVIVPIFKVENYLHRCVDSLRNQTYKKIEIILIDDGSPDKCPQICDEYKILDNRIVVIHQNNQGVAKSRNNGVKASRGGYITFVDSDDYVKPHYIEQLYRTLIESKKKISACSFSYIEDDLSDIVVDTYSALTAEEAIEDILLESYVQPSVWGKLFENKVLRNISFPEGMIFEDYAIIPKLLHIANGMAFVDNKLYFYTYNEIGITKAPFKKNQLQYFSIANVVNDFLYCNYPKAWWIAQKRDVNVAISFYKKMCQDGYDDREDMNLVRKIIRSGVTTYLRSHYSYKKKIAAILIACLPHDIVKKMLCK